MYERPCNRCGNKIIGPTLGGDTCLNCMMRVVSGPEDDDHLNGTITDIPPTETPEINVKPRR